ncbi:MAG TPA: CDP-2,3-bis-(O-geranylgeranyl)-sn-glycerol synthase [archaeon]|nr:CDP-2,3-bis-(O-geranylgeranyl)-sn-glycerol synthase [archaeon]
MEVLEIFFLFLIYAIPMYFANAAPIILHGEVPLDLGKKLFGKRIFGDGKTILGTFSGILIGVSAGALIYFLIPQAQLINNYFTFVVFLSSGAMFGDIFKSFLKRRIGLERGSHWAIADQWDFILGGLILSSLVRIPELEVVLVLLIITIFMHSITNILAYKLKLKKVPW